MPWDVFISHASEDKETIARPLADRLRQANITVWLDDAELTWGDSLSQKIDEGLANSTFGIVILSQHFFAKQWPQRELAGLVQREIAGQRKVILPLLHNIDPAYVAQFSPTLADKLSLNTSNLDAIVHAAQRLLQIPATPTPAPPQPPKPTLTADQWQRVHELSSRASLTIENRFHKPLTLIDFGKIPRGIRIPPGKTGTVLLETGDYKLKVWFIRPADHPKGFPERYDSNVIPTYLYAQQYFFICAPVPHLPGMWQAVKRQFKADLRLYPSYTEPWPELVAAGLAPPLHPAR